MSYVPALQVLFNQSLAWLRLLELVSPRAPVRAAHPSSITGIPNFMRFNALITGGAMALSVSLSTTASAADNAITMSSTAAPRTTISVVDLNLDSPSGVARLKGRISGVAAAMCLTNAVEPVRMRIARANCYRAALSSGQQQVDRLTIAQNELQSDARSGH